MSHHVRKAREILVEVRNEIGAGAKVFAVLAEAGVNITGLVGYSYSGKGRKAGLHLVLDDVARGKRALAKAGYKAVDFDVVLVDMPNRPGALARAAGKLAAAKVDIDYAYATAATKKSALIVFKVSSPAKAIKALL